MDMPGARFFVQTMIRNAGVVTIALRAFGVLREIRQITPGKLDELLTIVPIRKTTICKRRE